MRCNVALWEMEFRNFNGTKWGNRSSGVAYPFQRRRDSGNIGYGTRGEVLWMCHDDVALPSFVFVSFSFVGLFKLAFFFISLRFMFRVIVALIPHECTYTFIFFWCRTFLSEMGPSLGKAKGIYLWLLYWCFFMRGRFPENISAIPRHKDP